PADFGFSDPNDSPPNNLLYVRLDSAPSTGKFSYGTSGTLIRISDITQGLFKYTPPTHQFGANLAHFSFSLEDDGGTTGGGQDFSSSRTMNINVLRVNHTPQ